MEGTAPSRDSVALENSAHDYAGALTLIRALRALTQYALHQAHCRYWTQGEIDLCTCGFREAMQHVESAQHHALGMFLQQEFTLHSGHRSQWKIDCAALADSDIATLALLIAQRVGSFSSVEGVATGGARLAAALRAYSDATGPLLIVDDVCTTGASLEEQRGGRDAIGYAIFARGPVPEWCRALFTLDA